MDFKQFCNDFGVECREEGANWQPGWYQICCPFCGDSRFHGGWNIHGDYFNCWRCGWHSTHNLLGQLTNENPKDLQRKYSDKFKLFEPKSIKTGSEKFTLPTGSGELKQIHKNYLVKRNFDPDLLEKQWNLLGTGPVGNYKFRIIIPIFFNGMMVSFTSRDITNKQKLRYKACEKSKEIIDHKTILYGLDKIHSENCAIVEGPADVWRIGPGTLATFGTSWTHSQALHIAKKGIKQATIIYDPEDAAQEKADKLVYTLQGLGVEAFSVILNNCDPGDLKPDDIDGFRKVCGI